MKTSKNPHVIILVMIIVVSCQCLFANKVVAQDVVVKVQALLDTQPVALDSIIVVNETNNTSWRIGGLSQTTTFYNLNLTALTVGNSTPVSSPTINESFTAVPNGSSVKIIAKQESARRITAYLYSIDGKCEYQQLHQAQAGSYVFTVPVRSSGIYLLQLTSVGISCTFKVLVSKQNQVVSIEKAQEVLPTRQRSIAVSGSNFSFAPGNRIQVLVKKGSLKSLTWMGKPSAGNLIQLAIPKNNAVFDMQQTLSRGAQVNTISFSGVAFYSGCYYASTFYPPGKVADYFGFQYLRDNDPDESGHNTDFLTKAAYHMMHILNPTQMQMLIDLAVEQESLFNDYAYGRLTLIKAFHRYLDNDLPIGKTMLNIDSVKAVSRKLYLIDAEISYGRAQKFAQVINSLTEEQRDTLYKLSVVGMRTWPMPEKPQVTIPRGMNTWVMSNASELFSWFLRGLDADVYFCPERQGTYFGGFYMKDAPAVNNPGYGIDMQATANKGAFLLDSILTPTQSTIIKNIYTQVSPALSGIVQNRQLISTELRKAIAGQTVDKASIQNWSAQYGDYDGIYIYNMVEQFVQVARTLTQAQKDRLVVLRDLANYPCKPGKVFLYSAEIDEPFIPQTDFLFK